MDQALQEKLSRLVAKILDIAEEAARIAQEQFQKPEELKACCDAVDDTVAAYQAILAKVAEQDRGAVERRYGRQVTQLRRDTAWLPRRSHGPSVPLATDTQWSRVDEVAEPAPKPTPTAAPSETARPPARSAASAGPSVGDEIEAWCGACKGQRAHNIVAMVGDEPKQVLCRSCGARHGFRLSPARKKKSAAVARSQRGSPTRKELEQRRREEERSALFAELDAAAEVREFSKRARYRAGEIIEHPEHGRGKIEHVAKGSLLIRFRGGVRSISTI